MARAAHTPEEVATRAREIYERDIRAQVEPGQIGKYLVLDVESGSYEVDDDVVRAMKRAAEKYPGGVFHILRIGHRAMGRIGARTPQVHP